jgi:hypothetical protein
MCRRTRPGASPPLSLPSSLPAASPPSRLPRSTRAGTPQQQALRGMVSSCTSSSLVSCFPHCLPPVSLAAPALALCSTRPRASSPNRPLHTLAYLPPEPIAACDSPDGASPAPSLSKTSGSIRAHLDSPLAHPSLPSILSRIPFIFALLAPTALRSSFSRAWKVHISHVLANTASPAPPSGSLQKAQER